jgi:hypothetical protein
MDRGSRPTCAYCGHSRSGTATAPRPVVPPWPRRQPRARVRPTGGGSPAAPKTTPALRGKVVAITATPPASGDRPLWAPFLAVAAVLPGLIALAGIFALRTMTRALTRSRNNFVRSMFGIRPAGKGRSWSPGFFLGSAVGGMIGYRLGRRNSRLEHTTIRVDTAQGDQLCRYPAAPGALPLNVGDVVEITGRRHSDGVLRGRRFTNSSLSLNHTARLVAPWVPFAAALSLVLCVALIASALSLSAGGTT